MHVILEMRRHTACAERPEGIESEKSEDSMNRRRRIAYENNGKDISMQCKGMDGHMEWWLYE